MDFWRNAASEGRHCKKEGSFLSSHKLKLFNSWGIDHTDLPNYIGHVEIIEINGVSVSQNLCHKGLFR